MARTVSQPVVIGLLLVFHQAGPPVCLNLSIERYYRLNVPQEVDEDSPWKQFCEARKYKREYSGVPSTSGLLGQSRTVRFETQAASDLRQGGHGLLEGDSPSSIDAEYEIVDSIAEAVEESGRCTPREPSWERSPRWCPALVMRLRSRAKRPAQSDSSCTRIFEC